MGNPANGNANDNAEETALETLEREYDDTDTEGEERPKEKVATVASEEKPKAGAAKKPVEESDEKPKHSPRLLRMAAELDISEDEISELTPEALEVLVARETRRQLREARENARAEREADRRHAAKREELEEEAIEWGKGVDEDGKPKAYTDEDIHPAILPVIKAQAKKIRELESLLKGQTQTTEQQRMRAFEEAFDKSASRFKKTLGEGTLADLEDTPFAKKRSAIFKETLAIIQANPKTKLDKAVELAVRDVYGVELSRKGGKVATVASEEDDEDDDSEVGKRAASYAAGKVAKPTGRKGKPPRGPKAAEEAVENWFQHNGIGGTEDEDDDSDPSGY